MTYTSHSIDELADIPALVTSPPSGWTLSSSISGSDVWKVLAAFSKSESSTVGQVTSGWGAGETSGMVGYAYLK